MAMRFDPEDESTWPKNEGPWVVKFKDGDAEVWIWLGAPAPGWAKHVTHYAPLPKFDTPADTVEVRIAVAVNSERQWTSCGWGAEGNPERDGVLSGYAKEFDETSRVTWVRAFAYLPPEVVEVEGEVE